MGIKQDLVEKRNELDALNKKVAKIREECKVGNDFDLMKTAEMTGDLQARITEMRNMKTKQDTLGAEVDSLVDAVKGFDAPEPAPMAHPEQKGQSRKSVGERFVDSAEFKSALERGDGKARLELRDVGLKTLMQTGAGFAPQAVRTGEVEGYPVEPVGLFAILPKGQTSQTAYVYMEETTRTIAAAEKAETGAYGESAFAYTERSATVEDIGHWLPVTRKQLDDVPQIQSLIDQDLRQGLLERLDYQAINGDGSTPNLQGILAKSGINTQSGAGLKALDAIYKAIGKCQKNGFAEPNAILINGEDWEAIQLDKTDDGLYLWGHPSEVGPMRIWGRRVIPTYRVAKGTAVVGDFSKSIYAERTGVTVEISDSHDTYFTYNKLAIRCWTRGAIAWKRPSAFCKVTGLV